MADKRTTFDTIPDGWLTVFSRVNDLGVRVGDERPVRNMAARAFSRAYARKPDQAFIRFASGKKILVNAYSPSDSHMVDTAIHHFADKKRKTDAQWKEHLATVMASNSCSNERIAPVSYDEHMRKSNRGICSPPTKKAVSMTKDDLAQTLLDAGLAETKAGAKRIVDATLDAMKDELIGGGEVRLGGFGNFKVSRRNARTGRNPHSGETIKIAAKVVTKFKAAKHLADAVNNKKLLKALK